MFDKLLVYCRARCRGEEVGEDWEFDLDTSESFDPLEPLDLPKYSADPVEGRQMFDKSTRELWAEVGADGDPERIQKLIKYLNIIYS